MNRRVVLVAVAILGLWLYGALGTLAGPTAQAGVVDIAIGEMSITPNRIDTRVGMTVTLRVTNKSRNQHDLAFASAHMERLRGAEAILAPGESQLLSLTFTTPGVHQFSCTIHGPAVMSGAIFVAA